MNRTKKYLLALLPALVLWAGCSNMLEEIGKTAASNTTVFIYTADELNTVRNDPAGYYVLMADIDLSGYAAGEGWAPIGDNTNRFTGTFEGNGHTVSGLMINRNAHLQGLFGVIGSNGIVLNLGVRNSSIPYQNSGYKGLLAGENFGAIRGCYATGDVDGNGYLGVLVGRNFGTITNCYASGNVDAISFLGGLVGYNDGGTITNCYASGNVDGTLDCFGGLVGYNNGGTIINCYASGDVDGYNSSGGLVGYNDGGTITNCYASGDVNGFISLGGIVGYNDGSVTSCYFTDDSDNGFGTRKTSGWADPLSFTGWDFTSIWAVDNDGTVNGGYPYLQSIPPGS